MPKKKSEAELLREEKVFGQKMKEGKVKWSKKRSTPTNLTPKKKKRKK